MGPTTAPHKLPLELIEGILDVVDSHEDILSFALTCSYLNGVIQQKGYFQYRELITSEGHSHLWDHLVEHPLLASQVRVLTVYDVGYQPYFHRTFYRIPANISKDITSSRPDAVQGLKRCMPLMTGLQTINIYPRIRIFDAHDDLLAVLSSTWNSSSIKSLTLRLAEPQILHIDSLMWNLRDLRELDLMPSTRFDRNTTLSTELWPSFCNMLSLSPRLEVLGVPPFLGDTAPRARLPHLPQLRVLHMREQEQTITMQLALYAAAHPSIIEFSWDTESPLAVVNAPNLPRLERLIDTSPAIVNAMLSGRSPSTVCLSKLGRFALTVDTLPILRAVSATSLRSLTLSRIDSRNTLVGLAATYPDLEELHLPQIKELFDQNSGWISRFMRPSGITLKEASSLFPRLCIISGVTNVLPNTVAKVKGAYPRLRRVNGTRVDEL